MTHKPKTVLIVDDDEGMRDTLTAILKREYRVLRVISGEAALPGKVLSDEIAGLYPSILLHDKHSFSARYSHLRCWPKALRILVLYSKTWCRTSTT